MCRSWSEAGNSSRRRCDVHRSDTIVTIHVISQELNVRKEVVEQVFQELKKEGRTFGVSGLQSTTAYQTYLTELTERFNSQSQSPTYTELFNQIAGAEAPNKETIYALTRLTGATEERALAMKTRFTEIADRVNKTPEEIEAIYNRLRDNYDVELEETLYTRANIRAAEEANLPTDKKSIIAFQLVEDAAVTRGERVIERVSLSHRGSGVIQEGGYDEETGRMELVFSTSETVYSYVNVPLEVWEEISEDSPTPMSYFNQHVRGNYTYQYTNAQEDARNSTTIRCDYCGQFVSPSTNHSCPEREAAENTVVADITSARTIEEIQEIQEQTSAIAQEVIEENSEPEPEPEVVILETVTPELTETTGDNARYTTLVEETKSFVKDKFDFVPNLDDVVLSLENYYDNLINAQNQINARAQEFHTTQTERTNSLVELGRDHSAHDKNALVEVRRWDAPALDIEEYKCVTSADGRVRMYVVTLPKTETLRFINAIKKVSHHGVVCPDGVFNQADTEKIENAPDQSLITFSYSVVSPESGAPDETTILGFNVMHVRALETDASDESSYVTTLVTDKSITEIPSAHAAYVSNYSMFYRKFIHSGNRGISPYYMENSINFRLEPKDSSHIAPVLSDEEKAQRDTQRQAFIEEHGIDQISVGATGKTLTRAEYKSLRVLNEDYVSTNKMKLSNSRVVRSFKAFMPTATTMRRVLDQSTDDTLYIPINVEYVPEDNAISGTYETTTLVTDSSGRRIEPFSAENASMEGYVKLVKNEDDSFSVDRSFGSNRKCSCSEYARKYRCAHLNVGENVLIDRIESEINAVRLPVNERPLPPTIMNSKAWAIIDPDSKEAKVSAWNRTQLHATYGPSIGTRSIRDVIQKYDSLIFPEGTSEEQKAQLERMARRLESYNYSRKTHITSALKSGYKIKLPDFEHSFSQAIDIFNPEESGGRFMTSGNLSVSYDENKKPVYDTSQMRCTCGRFMGENGCDHVTAAIISQIASANLIFNKGDDLPQVLNHDSVDLGATTPVDSSGLTNDDLPPLERGYVAIGHTVAQNLLNRSWITEEEIPSVVRLYGDLANTGGSLDDVNLSDYGLPQDWAVRRLMNDQNHTLSRYRRDHEEFYLAHATPEQLEERFRQQYESYENGILSRNESYADAYRNVKQAITDRWSNVESGFDSNDIASISHAIAEVHEAGSYKPPVRTENVTNGICDPNIPGSRRFGVELEFDFPQGVDKYSALDAIGRDLAEAGLTQSSRMGGYHSGARSGWSSWNLESDASVSGELVSPLMADTPEDWENMGKALDILKRHGAIATVRTGSHVNISTASALQKPTTLAEFVREFRSHSDIIYRAAANPSRKSHRNTMYCAPNVEIDQDVNISTPTGDVLRGHSSHGIGIRPQTFGDVQKDRTELRVWDGSLDLGTIQMQVAASAGFIDRIEHDTLNTMTSNRKPAKQMKGKGHQDHDNPRDINEESQKSLADFVEKFFARKEDREIFVKLVANNEWASDRYNSSY